ncbi:MAG: hypothetical protein ABSC55_16945 [Syntrophorhabdales bacterium]
MHSIEWWFAGLILLALMALTYLAEEIKHLLRDILTELRGIEKLLSRSYPGGPRETDEDPMTRYWREHPEGGGTH